MKRAFISGIAGQDGAWLAKLLIEKGYHVYGGVRDENHFDDWRLKYLGIEKSIQYFNFDLSSPQTIKRCIQDIRPDEFYNLAAQSSVAESFHTPIETSLVDGMGVLYILEAIKNFSPYTKFFQAGSSEIFGNSSDPIQNEDTALRPVNPYGVAKSYAHWMLINYRNSFGLYCVNGILYSHESELRSADFFSRKVSMHVANWHLGNKKVLEVGNLDIEKDWGYAKEFAEGMYLSLQTNKPDDYIFATGKKIKIKHFLEHSYQIINIILKWEGKDQELRAYDSTTGELMIQINPKFYRPIKIDSACGDSTKARNVLHWNPLLDYRNISEIMVLDDIKKLKYV